MHNETTLIDQIYECSLLTELWPTVLGKVNDIAGGRTGFLYVSDGNVHNWATSRAGIESILEPLVKTGWIFRTERFRRMLALRHAGFVTELDIYHPEELVDDPTYRDLLYPRGLGWGAGTAIPLPTGDTFTIILEREYRHGPPDQGTINRLDALRPHIARSALLSARLHLERARVASQTLAAIGLPALVLDGSGKVQSANALIEKMEAYVHWHAHDLLFMRDRKANTLLRAALEGGRVGSSEGVRSFPVHDAASEEMMVAHVIPIRGSARDIFIRSIAVLVLTPVALPHAPPVELIRSLFDLTPSEARVARDLAAGSTVEDIASSSGVSANTVRTHVRVC